MARWIFIAVIFTLAPLAMLLLGLLFRLRPPGRPKEKSRLAAWHFAQRHLGRTWLIWGGVLLFLSTLIFLLVKNRDETVILVVGITLNAVQALVLFASSLPTRLALARDFDEKDELLAPSSSEGEDAES